MQVALRKVIQLLDTFKKEFYLALIVFLCAACAGVIMGFWQAIKTIPDFENNSQIKRIPCELFILMVMAVLFALIFRAVSMEFRANDEERALIWEAALTLGSALAALLFSGDHLFTLATDDAL